MNYVDLHVHSNASDGTLSPGEVVRYAASKQLKAMALTDHDTIAGITQAKTAAAECGIELIPVLNFPAFTRRQRSIFWDFLLMNIRKC